MTCLLPLPRRSRTLCRRPVQPLRYAWLRVNVNLHDLLPAASGLHTNIAAGVAPQQFQTAEAAAQNHLEVHCGPSGGNLQVSRQESLFESPAWCLPGACTCCRSTTSVSCTRDDLRAPRRVSSRDSGKTAVDAAFGEVMVTCEKIWWLLRHGERWLKPEKRGAGIMVRLGVNSYWHLQWLPATLHLFSWPYAQAAVLSAASHPSWLAGARGPDASGCSNVLQQRHHVPWHHWQAAAPLSGPA